MNQFLPYFPYICGVLALLFLALLLINSRLHSAKTQAEEQHRAQEKHIAQLQANHALLQENLTALSTNEATLLKKQSHLETQLMAEKKRALEAQALLSLQTSAKNETPNTSPKVMPQNISAQNAANDLRAALSEELS